MIVERTSQNIWNVLSDAWRALEGRETIEGIWETIASGVDRVTQYALDTQNSRSFEYMPPTMDVAPVEYTFIVSGVSDSQINVVPPEEYEIFRYYIDNWTLSIPTMIQEYSYTGTIIRNTYYEGVDYIISNMNTLRWFNTPFWDQRYPGMEVITVVAPVITRVNPVLMESWGQMLDIDFNIFNAYNTFGNDKYKHLKYFIWALVTKRLQWPTLKTLQDGISIARGVPFAYNGGTVVYTTNGITIGNDAYIIPSELTRIAEGTVISRFDLLTNGVTVDDYYSNPFKIINCVTTNGLNKYYTLVVDARSVHTTTYDSSFFTYYSNTIIPIQFFKGTPIVVGGEVFGDALYGNTYIGGTAFKIPTFTPGESFGDIVFGDFSIGGNWFNLPNIGIVGEAFGDTLFGVTVLGGNTEVEELIILGETFGDNIFGDVSPGGTNEIIYEV